MELTLNTHNEGNTDALKERVNVCMPTLVDGKAEWSPELIDFVASMKEMLNDMEHGKALAANQVWKEDMPFELPAVFVMKVDGVIQEYINPVIKGTGKSIRKDEGCLSFPGKLRKITRHKNASMLFQTLEDPGVVKALKFQNTYGLEAQAVQHEWDHMRGKTIFKL